MDLSLPQLLLIFVAGLLVSGFFSMLEAALISQDRHKLRHLADEGNTAATVMLELLANIDRLLAAILLCNNLANVVCATTAAIIVARLSGGWGGAIFVSTLAVTFLILIFGENLPQSHRRTTRPRHILGLRQNRYAYYLFFCVRLLPWLTFSPAGFCVWPDKIK